MDRKELNDWIQAIGIIAVVVSLVFVGLELRQSRQIASMDQLGIARQLVSEFRSMITDHADVWYRGCAGEQLTDVERLVFEQLVSEYGDLAFTLYARGTIGVYEGSSRWIDNYAANLHRFPALRTADEAAFERYTELSYVDFVTSQADFSRVIRQFGAELQSRLDELEKTDPAPELSPIYCGEF